MSLSLPVIGLIASSVVMLISIILAIKSNLKGSTKLQDDINTILLGVGLMGACMSGLLLNI